MSETEQPGLKEKLIEEVKKTLFIFVYLACFLGSFTWYRRIVLSEYHISYMHYGFAIFKALIFSKVIVIGLAFKIGERFNTHPLIIPTLYRTFCFAIFLFAFSVVEHLVTAWFERKTPAEALSELLAQGGFPEIISGTLVVLLALLPLFAVTELGRVLGKGQLNELFFKTGVLTKDEIKSLS